VLGPSTGPTTITFVSSDPLPGATLSGCGTSSSGCAGRIALHFRVRAAQSGHVLRVFVSLHDASLAACLLAASGPFDLTAGIEAPLDMALDQAGACPVPTDTTTLAATLEGTTSVASRQEWGVRYSLRP
jgi:hypothetical protein